LSHSTEAKISGCKIKILHIIFGYYPIVAGAEVFAQKIAEISASEGHEVHVITGRWGDLPRKEVINGVNVYRVHPYFRYVPAFLKALKLHQLVNFDLVHAHLATHGGFTGFLVALFIKRPLIVTVQGGDLLEYSEQRRAKSVIWPIIMRFMIHISLNYAKIVHAVSRFMAERARSFGAKNIVVVPNGVDTNAFHTKIEAHDLKRNLGIKKDETVVLTVSRLTPKNDIETLIKTMAIIKDEQFHIYKSLKLLIVGWGEQEKYLKELCIKLGVNEKVIFVGWVPHEEIPRYMAISHLFVRPSTQEGFGIVFIEAMSCGLPVVATKRGGIIDIVEDCVNGILIEPKNEKSLASTLIKLIEHPEYAQKIAIEGRKTALRKYDWLKIYQKIVTQIYSRVLAEEATNAL